MDLEKEFDIMNKAGITSKVIWDLSEEQLQKLGFSMGSKLKFRKGKKAWEEKQKMKDGKI